MCVCVQLLAIIGTLAAGAAIYWNPPWLFPLVILVGGLITIWTNRHTDCRAKAVRAMRAYIHMKHACLHMKNMHACTACMHAPARSAGTIQFQADTLRMEYACTRMYVPLCVRGVVSGVQDEGVDCMCACMCTCIM